ncbi:MAG: glycosyltransferase [Candidatus Hydrothermia bacterium]|jgi:glycosyltransferase involved in cell wall biosynthesis
MLKILLIFHLFSLFVVIYKFFSIKKLKRNYQNNFKKISILIPARNEEKNIERILNSVKNLDYENYEILIYDDLSEDRTYEIAKSFESEKIKVIKGFDKPKDWVGKNFALYNLVKFSSGEILLFLDADVEIKDREILKKISENINDSVITGFGKFDGYGKFILSIVPYIFSIIPINLGLNGQFWAIKKDIYLKYNPHLLFKNEILEDVKIGNYLKMKGINVKFYDLKDVFNVKMYNNFNELLEGLTKNSYRMFGKFLTPFALIFYVLFFILPFLKFWKIAILIIFVKFLSDLKFGFSIKETILTPIGFIIFGMIILRSWIFSISNRIYWKGRKLEGV